VWQIARNVIIKSMEGDYQSESGAQIIEFAHTKLKINPYSSWSSLSNLGMRDWASTSVSSWIHSFSFKYSQILLNRNTQFAWSPNWSYLLFFLFSIPSSTSRQLKLISYSWCKSDYDSYYLENVLHSSKENS
jgi:hypothetical protein